MRNNSENNNNSDTRHVGEKLESTAPDELFPAPDDEYSLEDEEEERDSEIYEDEDDDGDDNDKKHPSPWLLMLKMMLNPVEGWKQIRRSKEKADTVAASLFYPVCALSAVSCFFGCLYDSSITLSVATVEAVKIFVAFFFGNFLVLMLERFTFPKSHRNVPDSDFGKQFVLYNLSTLALFHILYQALPMIGPVLTFLPLWTIYLAIRGARFFRFPAEKKNLSVTLICLYLICAPLAIYWAFDILL